ncbi:MAG: prolyl oligopeptidase family serine peptidase [Acidobacteria bacterium]|nr:prolyl oligopeptidase family serine peptidase [Acidobacteriota bacterium]
MRIVIAFALLLSLKAAERPVPPPGVAVSAVDRKELEESLVRLSDAIGKIKDHPLAPDVLIFREAVRFALTYDEFFKPEEIGRARDLLKQGLERAAQLARGEAPWSRTGGLVVRGYRSHIDDSIQPYGLVIPPNWSSSPARRWRLDAWFHGRNETLSEVNFLIDRQTRPGEFTPPDTIVLHLYGRYSNANKFAGETDLFEALASVQRHYLIDENRISVRGFSMGGAAAWHLAAHHAGLWAAAAPGAGFSESAEFLNIARDPVQPNWWEKKLWRLYDATEYALNFFNLPLVAYSGEIDRQKQAADIIARFLEKEGMQLTHIIGPQTPHRYHPDSKIEIDRRISAIAGRGRDPYPRTIKFTTYTLAYNRMKWILVDSLVRHWERATVLAEVVDERSIKTATANVDALTVDFGPGGCPLAPDARPVFLIDGQRVESLAPPATDRSFRAHLRKTGAQWQAVSSPREAGLHKRHQLQGPIDDAFLRRFIFVLPTGEPMLDGPVTERIAAEQERSIREWRRHFRGDAIVRKDSEVTDADIASANLVLWGDPSSNRLLTRIADRLPVHWNKESVTLGARQFASGRHYPVLIYPNPLNPTRYVVLNSGFTFREFDYLNNARQVPKLPDWAMVDVSTLADGRFPGRIAEAGFFDERWQPQ